MKRPPREVYVRTVRHCNRVGLTVEPGLEYRPGDDFDFLTGLLYDICFYADTEHNRATPMELAEGVAARIADVYPDRAYFVEAHDEDGWIQIFQPFGVPRNADSLFARIARRLRALAFWSHRNRSTP